jgi:uncharacterized protein YjbI with pentapeptide repeats
MTRILSSLWRQRGCRGFLIAVIGSGIIALLLGPIAWWAAPAAGLRGKEKADVINTTRQILLTAVGGLALLTGAAFTTRTFYLTLRGQLTDRYAKAIALLASEKLTERIGGVYALEHLVIESERDHDTVIEVLAAFIREQTTSATAHNEAWNDEHHHEGGDGQLRVPADVQAALTVIGRRPRRPERNPVDLSMVDLCGVDLRGLNLDGVSLWRAKLRSAIMLDIQLNDANLCWAQLQDAGLTNACLRDAHLDGAQLQKAVLMWAQLQNADLTNANLEDAYLAEADLRGAIFNGTRLQGADFIAYPIGKPAQPAHGLTPEQLATAIMDDTTRLPKGLRDRLPSTKPPMPNCPKASTESPVQGPDTTRGSTNKS